MPTADVARPSLGVVLMQRVPGHVPYADGLALQRALHAQVAAGEAPDTVLLLEHEPVYTAGKRTEPHERPLGGDVPVVDVDRGGKITWHGPGQVTGYPVLRLADPVDVVAYVRALEQVLIDVCAEVGVATGRVEGRSGVWTPDGARKVAAIGIRVARGTTMHGFALNCDNSLAAYDAIVPCGLRDATVTTLSVEAGRHVAVAEVLPLLEEHLPALSAAAPA
ncbi:MAG: lipoate--protein ligase [Frankiales bacterium]|nr:lipoate--protein ligase [Frankiales bacterium]